jgi:hypothetical protein
MAPVKEYDARIDVKKRVTLRGARYNHYHVHEYSDGRIVLEPRVLAAPFEDGLEHEESQEGQGIETPRPCRLQHHVGKMVHVLYPLGRSRDRNAMEGPLRKICYRRAQCGGKGAPQEVGQGHGTSRFGSTPSGTERQVSDKRCQKKARACYPDRGIWLTNGGSGSLPLPIR